MVTLIDGVVAYLPPTAGQDVRTALLVFREQANEARTAKTKDRFERELESYLQSTAQLRDAAKRSSQPKIEAAVEAAIQALARAEHALSVLKKNA